MVDRCPHDNSTFLRIELHSPAINLSIKSSQVRANLASGANKVDGLSGVGDFHVVNGEGHGAVCDAV